MSTATEKKTIMAPFGMEADSPTNGDLLLQSILGCRLRGRMSTAKPTVNNPQDEDNTPVVPKDRVVTFGQLPEIPGMEIHVNPEKCTYKIIDPLFDDEEQCEKIHRALVRSDIAWKPTKIKGVAPQSGKLDVHRMKTLVRELVQIIEVGHGIVVGGVAPTMKEVDGLAGDYLHNAGTSSSQPRFEKEVPAWVDRLNRMGD